MPTLRSPTTSSIPRGFWAWPAIYRWPVAYGAYRKTRGIRLDKPDEELVAAFRREAGEKRFDVIIDYLWGHTTEALLKAITGKEFAIGESESRLVEVGESAGSTITLPAAVLRSTALTILGTAGIPSWDILTDAFQQVMNSVARGTLRIETERVPLAEIEDAWERDAHARRLVIIP
jgi:NADPH:quinone reductase-like Zn-dependent oxidoreductase